MIYSRLAFDILDLFFDGELNAELFKNQIKDLNIYEIEYTGFGAFISFKNHPEIYKFRAQYGSLKENKSIISDGVIIKNPTLNIEASAVIFIEDGIIESIEIFNYNGYEYPQSELEHYEVSQNWGDFKRKIIR
ncbi:hypothetical protein J2X31_003187 [Flavobacterium arsenatis]|uniref:Nuclear transport factor 2 family protein n=1 Tax=Flavobacterium arsenatis TaxID=1484332 RepID=A0ABU1TTI0_9FLAO|nr:hypothetical protein [Flavobacterium arsenatis]MDR6969160.1 hypothetical protein [Flavobacterium arsenatis]